MKEEKNFKVYYEKHFEITDKTYGVIIVNSMGYRCGYVMLENDALISNINTKRHYYEIVQEMEEGVVPKEDPIEQLNLSIANDLEMVHVHGGITFKGDFTDDCYSELIKEIPEKFRTGRVFGFDCGHLGDEPDILAMKQLGMPMGQAFMMADIMKSHPRYGASCVRSQEYVEKEIREMARQLIEISDKYKSDLEKLDIIGSVDLNKDPLHRI